MDLPDSEVKVKMITCPQCNKIAMVAVEHTIDKYTKKEIGELVANGCNANTVSLIEYRKMDIHFCDRDVCKPNWAK